MNLLTLEEEKFKEIEVQGYKFTISYLSPLNMMKVTQKRVSLQNGNNVETFTNADFLFMENVGMNDVCIEKMPDGFDMNKSSIHWQDIELIGLVADEIKKHTNDVQEKLKKNKPSTGIEGK